MAPGCVRAVRRQRVTFDRTTKLKSLFYFVAVAAIGCAAFVGLTGCDPQQAWVAVDRAEMQRALAQADGVVRGAARTTSRAGAEATAVALAKSIKFSKRQTLAAGTEPLPPKVRRALEGYFPLDVLDGVRWTTAGRRIDLGSVLAGWYLREGAVTLDDTVVFSDGGTARHIGLWAHELTHVTQYRELGVRDFARLYTTHWPMLERQAGRNAERVIASINAVRKAKRRLSAPLAPVV